MQIAVNGVYTAENSVNRTKWYTQIITPKKLRRPHKSDCWNWQIENVAAVFVTFIHGFSNDTFFTSIEQQSEEGKQVLVYSACSYFIGEMIKGFKSESEN